MIIRREKPTDIEAITRVTEAAFAHHPHSDHAEQHIVAALRAAGALTISLVAEVEGAVVGHIAFSPVAISDGSRDWYGLGPVSVAPAFQNRGIGTALVQEGLAQLRAMGAKGCVVAGEPGYYQRLGFRNRPKLVYAGVPQDYFLALEFGEERAAGTVRYHDAFSATSSG